MVRESRVCTTATNINWLSSTNQILLIVEGIGHWNVNVFFLFVMISSITLVDVLVRRSVLDNCFGIVGMFWVVQSKMRGSSNITCHIWKEGLWGAVGCCWWYCCSASWAFSRFDNGSQVSSSDGYPFQCTRYWTLFHLFCESRIVSTSYSGSSSLFMISGGCSSFCCEGNFKGLKGVR
jgi:hypothetical protein